MLSIMSSMSMSMYIMSMDMMMVMRGLSDRS